MRVLFFIPGDYTDYADNELQDQFCPNAFYSRKLKPVQTQKNQCHLRDLREASFIKTHYFFLQI